MTTTLTRPLADLLERAHVPYELIHHRRTETAAAEAAALGVPPSELAKTVVLTTQAGFVRAVLPASERLDLHKVRRLLGTKEVQLAPESLLAGAYPQFELGAVPPFGGPAGDRVIVDVRLRSLDSIALEAGSHEESVRLRTADLVELSGAMFADICRE